MNAPLPMPVGGVDRFAMAVAALPSLPKTIHYEDEYDEKIRAIKVDQCKDSLVLHDSGASHTIRFTRFDQRVRPLIREFLLGSLMERAPRTVILYHSMLTTISAEDIEKAALSEPSTFRTSWSEMTARYSSDSLVTLKALLSFLCQVRFEFWGPTYREFISRALPIQGRDAYSTVRSGDAFLTIDEEARLVNWIDEATIQANSIERSSVEIACLVVCSYQFGMRPKQLGMTRIRDCSIRFSEEDKSAIVHITFQMIKQKDAALSGLALHRKVKREWAPLFVALLKFSEGEGKDTFLFGFSNRIGLSIALNDKLNEIVAGGTRRVAYDLRHSMAQRLVDSGASHEELAAAMGHSQLASGLVYFRASANQAELVNKALGISSVYQRVAKIAADKYISPEELHLLKEDQQIAGVPHGIPIAGIGGCKTGQPSCPYNPVTACYGCPKFMPVIDIAMHEKVLEEFRGIVHLYKDVSRGENHSPAYLQLQRTINEVMGVIQDLKEAHAE